MGATAADLRDEKGKKKNAAICMVILFAADVITNEAMAMTDGLNFANFLGFNRVEAESDSQNVIIKMVGCGIGILCKVCGHYFFDW